MGVTCACCRSPGARGWDDGWENNPGLAIGTRRNPVLVRQDGQEEHRFNVARPGEEVRSTMRLRP